METNYNKRPHYPDSKDPHSFENGLAYQDFVANVFHEHLSMTISNYQSALYQFGTGENKQGIEIKLDTVSKHTERLSIEVAEKSKASNETFVESGILRNDNTWLYVQGNWSQMFIFARSTLNLLYKTGRYEVHEEPTIRAFFLPFKDARKYAARVLEFDGLGRRI